LNRKVGLSKGNKGHIIDLSLQAPVKAELLATGMKLKVKKRKAIP